MLLETAMPSFIMVQRDTIKTRTHVFNLILLFNFYVSHCISKMISVTKRENCIQTSLNYLEIHWLTALGKASGIV